ncbi:hypothetical protein BJ508DRAFT_341118 [Ascobolus immersus RN42]|uniref:Uncharacterized protein n=1 Tax=Ascobolus immersus RN42 TaxID=1160509 RepID=A0A3N4IES6_ASCIM|nr:hypothetical protein BJ508DRAFT_341118 [Ascobolus immersus RN42]
MGRASFTAKLTNPPKTTNRPPPPAQPKSNIVASPSLQYTQIPHSFIPLFQENASGTSSQQTAPFQTTSAFTATTNKPNSKDETSHKATESALKETIPSHSLGLNNPPPAASTTATLLPGSLESDQQASVPKERHEASRELLQRHLQTILPGLAPEEVFLSASTAAIVGYRWMCSGGYRLPTREYYRYERKCTGNKTLSAFTDDEHGELAEALRDGRLRAVLVDVTDDREENKLDIVKDGQTKEFDTMDWENWTSADDEEGHDSSSERALHTSVPTVGNASGGPGDSSFGFYPDNPSAALLQKAKPPVNPRAALSRELLRQHVEKVLPGIATENIALGNSTLALGYRWCSSGYQLPERKDKAGRKSFCQLTIEEHESLADAEKNGLLWAELVKEEASTDRATLQVIDDTVIEDKTARNGNQHLESEIERHIIHENSPLEFVQMHPENRSANAFGNFLEVGRDKAAALRYPTPPQTNTPTFTTPPRDFYPVSMDPTASEVAPVLTPIFKGAENGIATKRRRESFQNPSSSVTGNTGYNLVESKSLHQQSLSKETLRFESSNSQESNDTTVESYCGPEEQDKDQSPLSQRILNSSFASKDARGKSRYEKQHLASVGIKELLLSRIKRDVPTLEHLSVDGVALTSSATYKSGYRWIFSEGYPEFPRNQLGNTISFLKLTTEDQAELREAVRRGHLTAEPVEVKARRRSNTVTKASQAPNSINTGSYLTDATPNLVTSAHPLTPSQLKATPSFATSQTETTSASAHSTPASIKYELVTLKRANETKAILHQQLLKDIPDIVVDPKNISLCGNFTKGRFRFEWEFDGYIPPIHNYFNAPENRRKAISMFTADEHMELATAVREGKIKAVRHVPEETPKKRQRKVKVKEEPMSEAEMPMPVMSMGLEFALAEKEARIHELNEELRLARLEIEYGQQRERVLLGLLSQGSHPAAGVGAYGQGENGRGENVEEAQAYFRHMWGGDR